MNLPSSIFCFLTVTLPIFARDLVPDYWFETVPSSDRAIQQSLISRTVAGVYYKVETSENLTTWTQEEAIYGMGHEFVVPMREFTPAPPLPPGENPPAVLPILAVHASVMLRRSNGLEGGTVATWKSFDNGGPMLAHIEEDLHEGWERMPLYANRHASFYFWVSCPWQFVAPPAEDPDLGVKDAAFIAQLEASLPEMNQHVATSASLTRNSPPQSPPSPGAKKFWRIRADWSVDTDGDESPDWAEFEMAGNALHPSHSFADAFVADTDGNGTADGHQMDLDDDNTVDAKDPGVGDDLASQEIGPLPRYAVFPISRPTAPAGPPISINNLGTVLWSDGCWTDAKWRPLTMTSTNLAASVAMGQNDLGEIVGNGQWTIESDLYGLASVAVRWESPSAVPTAVLLTGAGENAGSMFHGPIIGNPQHGPLISNDGRIIATTSYYKDATSNLTQGEVDDGKPAIWTLPGNERTVARQTLNQGFAYPLDQDTYWGYNEQTKQIMFKAPGDPPPPANRAPRNLVRSSTGELHAFYNVASPQILKNGEWKSSLKMLNGIDMSTDATVIASKFGTMAGPIRLNGKWQPIATSIPGATDWKDNTVSLLDTTNGGWILARRGTTESPLYGALLPLRVKGDREIDGLVLQDAVGVDDFSIGSTEPGAAIADKIWIMAPSHGGETRVKVFGPIDDAAPVEISGEGLEFNGGDASVSLSEPESTFTVRAKDTTEAGGEIPLVIKLGSGATVESLSSPISFKVMKRRTVRVMVWKVKADDGELPTFNPTEQELESHLNKIFEPQINAVFDCNLETIGPLGYDTANATVFGAPAQHSNLVEPANGVLDFTTDFSAEMSTIRTGGHVTTFNINLYIVGGSSWVAGHRWNPEEAKLVSLKAQAIANRNESNTRRECWIPGESITPSDGLQTIAHEIGHILFGDGHPEDNTGPAPLPATPKPPRLMCSDPKLRAIGGLRRLTVKGEWDATVEWFKLEIRDGRIPQ